MTTTQLRRAGWTELTPEQIQRLKSGDDARVALETVGASTYELIEDRTLGVWIRRI